MICDVCYFVCIHKITLLLYKHVVCYHLMFFNLPYCLGVHSFFFFFFTDLVPSEWETKMSDKDGGYKQPHRIQV